MALAQGSNARCAASPGPFHTQTCNTDEHAYLDVKSALKGDVPLLQLHRGGQDLPMTITCKKGRHSPRLRRQFP